jgi:DNA modification methylase
MAGMEAGSVDAVVTDPPYGLEFMGKEWDRLDWRDGGGMSKPGIGERSTAWVSYGGETANATCATCGGRMRGAKKCQCESPDWRVKGEPYLPRTAERARQMQDWHHAWAVAALRVLKPSHYLLAFGGTRTWHHLACALEDAGFEIRDTLMWLYGSGFPKGKACLKPAWEPVILARKPGPMRELGIEECRIATSESGSRNHHGAVYNGVADGYQRPGKSCYTHKTDWEMQPAGRWPANLVLDEEAADDAGEWARYFYCAKASRAERNAGLEGMEARAVLVGAENPMTGKPVVDIPRQNHHPTVKPVALMRWLVKLVAREGDTVLDPFTGSGTTGVACAEEGRDFIGIEKEAEYVEIARRRIEAAAAQERLPV